MNKIKVLNPYSSLSAAASTSCIICTSDNAILLQKRPPTYPDLPNYIGAFGGKIDAMESPLQSMIRELAEEVGVAVPPNELIFLNAYTEEITQHKNIVFGYFWHDKKATITGCYQGQALYIKHLYELQAYPLIIDDVPWLIKCCMQRKLISLLS